MFRTLFKLFSHTEEPEQKNRTFSCCCKYNIKDWKNVVSFFGGYGFWTNKTNMDHQGDINTVVSCDSNRYSWDQFCNILDECYKITSEHKTKRIETMSAKEVCKVVLRIDNKPGHNYEDLKRYAGNTMLLESVKVNDENVLITFDLLPQRAEYKKAYHLIDHKKKPLELKIGQSVYISTANGVSLRQVESFDDDTVLAGIFWPRSGVYRTRKEAEGQPAVEPIFNKEVE